MGWLLDAGEPNGSVTVDTVHPTDMGEELLADLYRQEYLGLLHELPAGPGVLSTDLRAFISNEDGSANAIVGHSMPMSVVAIKANSVVKPGSPELDRQ